MKTILSLSGGLDSTTLLAFLREKGREVVGVWFDYGSKHNPYERESVLRIAYHYLIPLEIVKLDFIKDLFESNLLQSGGDIPEGHYESASMSQTVVPARNIIFLSILSGLAWSRGARTVAIAIHQGDHAIYPDCRPEFYNAMGKAINFGTDNKVSIEAPFVNMTKADICKIGLDLKVPYQLTRTCYKQQERACGKCGACTERLEAFEINKSKDFVEYE